MDDSARAERVRQARVRLARAKDWTFTFLVNPHPQLGREGDVCPFVGRAHAERLLGFHVFDARKGPGRLADLVRRLRENLRRQAVSAGVDAHHLARVVVPFGLAEHRLTDLVNTVQAELKPEFVERGMMIGEFYPGHDMPGLHSPQFRPLSSPLPLLAIRYMVVTDLLFLAGPHIPPGDRMSYLDDYERTLAGRLPAGWRARLDRARNAARVESAKGGVLGART